MSDFWSNLTGGAVHTGSWFGLPDFGVTEARAAELSGGQTTDLSNALSNNYQTPYDYSGTQSYPMQSIPGPTPTYTQTNQSAPSGQILGDQTNPTNQVPTVDPYAQVKSDINSGYDSYFNQLNQMLNSDLPAQQTAQQGIINEQYNQGINTLSGQKTTGLYDLNRERERIDAGQVKSLRDLSSNLRNSFMAGNVYLGARGAGDSSAANQYSYALTKMGNRQRGDIMSQAGDYKQQVADREFKLNTIYDTETRNLDSVKNQKTMDVANWFSTQQQTLRQAQATGQLSRGQDLANLSKTILNQALTYLQSADTEARNRKLMLDQWAMNNSTTFSQLKGNMAQVSNIQTPALNAQQIAGTPTSDAYGGFNVAPLWSTGKTEKKYNPLTGQYE